MTILEALQKTIQEVREWAESKFLNKDTYRPNWNSVEGEDGYIENRTHYINPVDVNITLLEKTGLSSISTPNGILYRRDIATVDNDFNTCTITYDGTNVVVVPIVDGVWTEQPASKFFYFGPTKALLVLSSGTLTIYCKASYYNPDLTLSDCWLIHPIDEQYIPVSIARTNDLNSVKTDVDVLMNSRTHYTVNNDFVYDDNAIWETTTSVPYDEMTVVTNIGLLTVNNGEVPYSYDLSLFGIAYQDIKFNEMAQVTTGMGTVYFCVMPTQTSNENVFDLNLYMSTRISQIIIRNVKTAVQIPSVYIPMDNILKEVDNVFSIDSVVYAEEDSTETGAVPLNADTLGGRLPAEFALAENLAFTADSLQSQIDGKAPAGDYATQSFVTNKIAEAQLGGDSGEIDLTGYATKDDLANIDYPVDSVNGKTGAVNLSAGDVGAHPNTWLPTPAQIGAPNSITRPVYDTWFSFRIVGNGVNNGQPNERQPVTLIISGQSGQIINAQFIASTIDGHPLGDCFVSSAMNMGIDVISYETVGNETRYSISLTGVTHAYASAQITIPSIDSMTLGSYNGSYGTTSVLSTKTLSHDFVGAAPAGYGYGEALKGFYRTYEANLEGDFDAELATMADKQTKQIAFSCSKELMTGATFFGTLIRNTSEYAVLFGYSADNACVFKAKGGGVWTPFEWVNPPMVNGVEYRTTERWQGKAVYTMLIDCKAMPNTGIIAIPHIATTGVIRCTGMNSVGDSLPMHYQGKDVHIYSSKGSIYITTNYDASALTATAQIWYTKD